MQARSPTRGPCAPSAKHARTRARSVTSLRPTGDATSFNPPVGRYPAPVSISCGLIYGETQVCGVVAVGRCDRCSRAFCQSHQAVILSTSGFDGLTTHIPQPRCVDCARRAELQLRERQLHQAVAASAQHESRTEEIVRLKRQIIESPMAVWEPRSEEVREEARSVFRQRVQYRTSDLPPAVRIGPIMSLVGSYSEVFMRLVEYGLTAEGEVVAMTERNNPRIHGAMDRYNRSSPERVEMLVHHALIETASRLGIPTDSV